MMKLGLLSRVFVLLVLITFTFAAVCGSADAPNKPGKIKVLFEVGGRVHDSVNLPPILKKLLEDTGDYEITISDNRDLLRSENIQKYDLLMLYITRGNITPEQEKGLLEFVQNGKGLVGIHASTSGFENSDAYTKMIGARFTNHGSGTFKVKITGKRHSSMQGMSDFTIWDETYRHKFHPEGKINVLMRRESDGDPVTWVSYYGEGRVFITSLGHDKRTFNHPAFQDTIKRGCSWAVKRTNP
jgi:type 1 glutamine amidotransferase